MAIDSRRLWLEFARKSGSFAGECGSIHLAHHDDEWDLLQEFAASESEAARQCTLLTPDEVLKKTPAAQPDQLRGGLWSPTELVVNPRRALCELPRWLGEEYGIAFHYNTLVRRVAAPELEASDGRVWQARRIIVCGGADFQTLFPEVFAGSGLKRCKLQMLRTAAQPSGWHIGPHVAGGLSLRHYAGFAHCESLAALKQRIAEETPELDRYGIHVMAAQNDAGQVILGDSHEYGEATPFDREEIHNLMLRELHKLVRLPDWSIEERWHGVYAKHPDKLYFAAAPQPGVRVITAVGGAGMTLSFGMAEQLWNDTDRASPTAETGMPFAEQHALHLPRDPVTHRTDPE